MVVHSERKAKTTFEERMYNSDRLDQDGYSKNGFYSLGFDIQIW